MIASGFLETGNGISFSKDGSHDFFDFLDFLPSGIAGFLIISLAAGSFDLAPLLQLFIIFAAVVVVLVILNLALGRKIVIE